MKLEYIVALALAAPLAGCMSSSPVWESHFGEAVQTAVQAQIIDPDAAEHGVTTQGIDGKSATSALNLYDKSFQQPPATNNAFTMGVSGGGGGGSQ